LTQENLRLSLMVRQQQGQLNRQLIELRRLERDSPGITKITWSEDGSIDISGEIDDELVKQLGNTKL